MKFQVLMGAALVLALAACKTPYRATDTPRPATDGAATTTDTASTSRSRTSASVDSSRMTQTDTTTMRSSAPDSARMQSTTDTARTQQATDSAMNRAGVDSAQNRSNIDSSTMRSGSDSSRMRSDSDSSRTATSAQQQSVSQAPVTVEPIFLKQYPAATSVVWSAYDSLAAIPIDMRLTGWKKLDAEDHMVKFDLDGETYYAWYDSNGKWIGSAAPMTDYEKLPAAVKTAVNNAIKTRYAGYSISQVNREFQTGKKSYEVELSKDENKVRMLVSSAGKIGQIYRYKSTSK